MDSERGGLGWAGEHADSHRLDVARALEAGQLAAWHWDPERGIHWLAGARHLLGTPDALGSPGLEGGQAQSEHERHVSEIARDAWATGRKVNTKIRSTSPGIRWFDVIGQVLRDPQGTPSRVTGVLLEVTDDHEAAEAVRSALAEAEATLAQLLTVVGEWDPNSDVLTVARQPPGLTLVDNPPNGVPLADVLTRTGQRDAGRVRDALKAAVESRQAFTLEILLQDDDRSLRRALLRGGFTGDPAARVWIAVTVLD